MKQPSVNTIFCEKCKWAGPVPSDVRCPSCNNDLAPWEPRLCKAAAPVPDIGLQQRELVAEIRKQAYDAGVADERERCAKIAESWECGSENWNCTEIARKIRSGK